MSRTEYHKDYYKKNKDKINQRAKDHYHKHKQLKKIPQEDETSLVLPPTSDPNYYKIYYKMNKEYIKQKARERYHAQKVPKSTQKVDSQELD